MKARMGMATMLAMQSMLALGSAATSNEYIIQRHADPPIWPGFDMNKLTSKHRRWRDNNGAFGKAAIKRKKK
jgi:hypothetical protein